MKFQNKLLSVQKPVTKTHKTLSSLYLENCRENNRPLLLLVKVFSQFRAAVEVARAFVVNFTWSAVITPLERFEYRNLRTQISQDKADWSAIGNEIVTSAYFTSLRVHTKEARALKKSLFGALRLTKD